MTHSFEKPLSPNRRQLLGSAAAALCGSFCCPMQASAALPHFRDYRQAVAHAREPLMSGYDTGYVVFFGNLHYDFSVFVDPTFSAAHKTFIHQAMEHHFQLSVSLPALAKKAAQNAQW